MPLATHTLTDIDAEQWDALNSTANPFLSHAFLNALEQHQCVGNDSGWFPQHLTIREGGQLIAAMPLYVKTNPYGEFVFDDAWEQAYRQSGIHYYPKLVSAIPYTPVTSDKLLGHDLKKKAALVKQAIQLARDNDISSIHWLFHSITDATVFATENLHYRLGCQYHWHNNNYTCFDDFLGTLTSKKRKMIRRERRIVQEQSLECKVLHGSEVPTAWWQIIYHYYAEIYQRKWGIPSLNQAFFKTMGKMLPENFLVVVALLHKQPVACSICYRDQDTLYGRHWGCDKQYAQLHFETCYYTGIEYSIQNNLQKFESGAQGEHKIWRGFLPTPTWSAHWINDQDFSTAVKNFCYHERKLIRQHIKNLLALSPYRENAAPAIHQSLLDNATLVE